MSLRPIYGQISSGDVAAIGDFLATCRDELISRETIWGSAPDEASREKIKNFRKTIEAAMRQHDGVSLPNFTTLHAPMVYLTPYTAVISFHVALTTKGLFAFLTYLNKLGFKYVIREEDEEDFFSPACWKEDGKNLLMFDSEAAGIPALAG